MTTSKALHGIDPLKDLLSEVLSRLESLETKVGIAPTSHHHTHGNSSVSFAAPAPNEANLAAAGEVPAVKAYDSYMKNSVSYLAQACDDLGGLDNMGDLIQKAWEGVRLVIVLASRSKQPEEDLTEALAPHMKPVQDAVVGIRTLKLDRDWDRHQKAIIEMLACLSWVYMRPPKAPLPVALVKETLGSAEFWSNRIRKDFKGKNDTQIAFCDSIKAVINGLAEYIDEFHKTGLTFSPRGVSLAEAAIRLSDPTQNDTSESQRQGSFRLRHPTIGSAVVGGNIAGMMEELSKRKSTEGDSAATGLKKVTKDMQTWRKEFKPSDGSPAPAPIVPPKPEKKEKKTPLKGLPIFEYQDRGFKWVVENHTKESAAREVSKDSVITIEISDPKQQVYIYNCDGVTFKVNGKFKSMCLDMCTGCAVILDDLISGAEVVNCKKVQLQVNGICPVFTIDKTVNIVVYLSQESLSVSTFTTSLSSEMNVSFPDGEDQKEVPIPEQFTHKLVNGSVKSDVSDLYH